MAAASRRKNAKTAPVVAFLDTNIFLHFLPFHEVDWRSALSAQTVELRVAATVVKELNKKKDGPGPDHIRDRARKVSRRYERLLFSGTGNSVNRFGWPVMSARQVSTSRVSDWIVIGRMTAFWQR